MYNSARLFTLIITALLSMTACAAYDANNLVKKELSSEEKIENLETELDALKRQFQMIYHNQQALAKHIGLNTDPHSKQQPTVNIENSLRLGSKQATVALIEFTDLHCPFCKKFHTNTFEQLNKKYVEAGKLLFVGKHYPIVSIHKNAINAAKALECASQQASNYIYLQAKNWLFNKGSNFKVSQFSEDLKLNNEVLDTCLQSKDLDQKITFDINLAKSIGINSTPSFVIGLHKNGEIKDWRIIKGAKTFEQFSQAIDTFITLANEKESK